MKSEISKDKQIELLANAIGDIAKRAMIISPDAELTGPQLLLVADNCSDYIKHLEEQIETLEKSMLSTIRTSGE